MAIKISVSPSRLNIEIAGEIDHHSAKEFIHAIEAKIETYNPGVCVLDFTDVSFMDSSGIAVVINTMRTVARRNGRLIVSGLQSQPMKVFKASGIDKIVENKEKIS